MRLPNTTHRSRPSTLRELAVHVPGGQLQPDLSHRIGRIVERSA
jgi:hypothetical protein